MFIRQFAIGCCFSQILNNKGKGRERLLPLVCDVIQHLPQGRLAVLLDEHDVLFTVFLDFFTHPVFQCAVEFFQQLLLFPQLLFGQFEVVYVGDDGMFRDRAVRIVNGNVHHMVPASILRAIHLPMQSLSGKYTIIDAPRTHGIPAVKHLVAEFAGSVVPGPLDQLPVHELDAVILGTDIDEAIVGIDH